MRLSCNGCRVLRKGCSDDCTIRPCLHWIKNPESQANATVFLAKFYGRAGLINLINSRPRHLRPAIFRSLLYEACGRLVNPVYGSVGLLWSGSWNLCQAAVEAVLKGEPVAQMPAAAVDIRHVSKGPTGQLHKVVKTRTRFKRAAPAVVSCTAELAEDEPVGQVESGSSAETGESSHVSQASGADEGEVSLDLTLAVVNPVQAGFIGPAVGPTATDRFEIADV